MTAREAYEADVAAHPTYCDGKPRASWNEIGEAARAAWEGRVSAPTLESETNKDRNGSEEG